MSIVYLNGDFIPLTEAKISVLDRGFIFGDGVYEVIPVFAKRPFHLKQHLARLQKSLQSVDINFVVDPAKWREICQQLINSLASPDQWVYLQITRGVMQKREHSYSQELIPTVFAMTNTLTTKTYAELKQGGTAITAEDPRWQWCHIKATTLLPNILLYHQARHVKAIDTILLRNGYAVEASTSNLFIVKNKQIITPPLSSAILSGITRELVLELCEQHHLPYVEQTISKDQLFTADEVWLCSSSKEIMPITMIDDKKIGNGHAGPLWEKMIALYFAYKKALHEGSIHD